MGHVQSGRFADGTTVGVDIWTEWGPARLDHAWRPNARVNDVADQGKMAPSVTFVLSNTAGATETHFIAVWEDEREQDHYPDIAFARSTDGGGSWSADVLVGGAPAQSEAEQPGHGSPTGRRQSVGSVAGQSEHGR